MDELDVTEITAELDAKAAALEAQIAELTRPVRADETIGFGKRIGDGTTQAIQQMADVSTAESLQRTLNEVRAAQERVREGTFGNCTVCGEPIAPERLEFRPWSATCVEHSGL